MTFNVGDLVRVVESGHDAVVVSVRETEDSHVWLGLVFNAGTPNEYRTVAGPADVYLLEDAL